MTDQSKDDLKSEQPTPEMAPGAEYAPEGYAERLKTVTGTSAAQAVEWVSKLMPGKNVMGVQLPGAGMVDPSNKAQFQDFLKKDDFLDGRRKLIRRVSTWIEMLKSVADADEAAEQLDAKMSSRQALFDENQARASSAVRELETTYRMLAAFYANAQPEAGAKVDAWIFNAHADKLMNPDDTENFDKLAKAIRTEFRGWSMRKNYGLMVLPGWLGDVKKIDRLATLAYQNKMMVLSDGPDMPTAEKLEEFISMDNFASLMSVEAHKRNIMLLCNYLLARSRSEFEDEELFVPPSFHVAGAIYRNDITKGIHQSTAGPTFGKLVNAEGTRFHGVWDRKVATELMAKHGMNAIVPWDGYCTVVGDQNLSVQEGYKSYSRVRVEDWIVKNVLNFLNYQSFKAITSENLTDWRMAVWKFLDSIRDRQGGKEITGFDIEVESTEQERKNNIVRVTLKVEYIDCVRYFNLKVQDKGSEGKEIEEQKQ